MSRATLATPGGHKQVPNISVPGQKEAISLSARMTDAALHLFLAVLWYQAQPHCVNKFGARINIPGSIPRRSRHAIPAQYAKTNELIGRSPLIINSRQRSIGEIDMNQFCLVPPWRSEIADFDCTSWVTTAQRRHSRYELPETGQTGSYGAGALCRLVTKLDALDFGSRFIVWV